MPSVALFYGSTYGDTADAAESIARELGALLEQEVPLFDIADGDVEKMTDYDALIVGCSTWNIGQLQYDWELVLDELEQFDFSGKRIALFGAGDQVGYHDTYLDALGTLAELFEARGATIIGYWPTAGYEHSDSLALRGDHFVGLGLDYDNQAELNEDRIRRWCLQLAGELEGHEEIEPERLAAA